MPTSAQLAKIHIMLPQAHLRDSDYRELLDKRFNVRSAKDLNNAQISELVTLLASMGARDTTPRPRKRRASDPKGVLTQAQQFYIDDLYRVLGWNSLAQKMGFNEHTCGKKLPQTHADGTKVIVGLEAILGRAFALCFVAARWGIEIAAAAAAHRTVKGGDPMPDR